jgi:hypothetical protein
MTTHRWRAPRDRTHARTGHGRPPVRQTVVPQCGVGPVAGSSSGREESAHDRSGRWSWPRSHPRPPGRRSHTVVTWPGRCCWRNVRAGGHGDAAVTGVEIDQPAAIRRRFEPGHAHCRGVGDAFVRQVCSSIPFRTLVPSPDEPAPHAPLQWPPSRLSRHRPSSLRSQRRPKPYTSGIAPMKPFSRACRRCTPAMPAVHREERSHVRL